MKIKIGLIKKNPLHLLNKSILDESYSRTPKTNKQKAIKDIFVYLIPK